MPLYPEPLIATGERPEPWEQTFTLAASDLTFLWQECRRCFYLKVLMGARQLTTIPSVFTQMDREQRRFFDGHSPREIHPDLPAGRMLCDETKVVSVPLAVPGTDARVRLRGVLDCLVACDNGGFGVLDFKTAQPNPKQAVLYRPQLHAYAFGLENPEEGATGRGPIEHLGLVCFPPQGMLRLDDGRYAYATQPTWVPVERDDAWFNEFLAEICDVLTSPVEPTPGERCGWCRLR